MVFYGLKGKNIGVTFFKNNNAYELMIVLVTGIDG